MSVNTEAAELFENSFKTKIDKEVYKKVNKYNVRRKSFLLEENANEIHRFYERNVNTWLYQHLGN